MSSKRQGVELTGKPNHKAALVLIGLLTVLVACLVIPLLVFGVPVDQQALPPIGTPYVITPAATPVTVASDAGNFQIDRFFVIDKEFYPNEVRDHNPRLSILTPVYGFVFTFGGVVQHEDTTPAAGVQVFMQKTDAPMPYFELTTDENGVFQQELSPEVLPEGWNEYKLGFSVEDLADPDKGHQISFDVRKIPENAVRAPTVVSSDMDRALRDPVFLAALANCDIAKYLESGVEIGVERISEPYQMVAKINNVFVPGGSVPTGSAAWTVTSVTNPSVTLKVNGGCTNPQGCGGEGTPVPTVPVTPVIARTATPNLNIRIDTGPTATPQTPVVPTSTAPPPPTVAPSLTPAPPPTTVPANGRIELIKRHDRFAGDAAVPEEGATLQVLDPSCTTVLQSGGSGGVYRVFTVSPGTYCTQVVFSTDKGQPVADTNRGQTSFPSGNTFVIRQVVTVAGGQSVQVNFLNRGSFTSQDVPTNTPVPAPTATTIPPSATVVATLIPSPTIQVLAPPTSTPHYVISTTVPIPSSTPQVCCVETPSRREPTPTEPAATNTPVRPVPPTVTNQPVPTRTAVPPPPQGTSTALPI